MSQYTANILVIRITAIYSVSFIIVVSPQILVVVFPQAPFRVTNVPGLASAGIIQLRNAPWLPLEVP